MSIYLCVYSQTAIILKLWSLKFYYIDKWKIEKKDVEPFFVIGIDDKETPKYMLLVGVTCKVQHINLNKSKVSS